MFRTTKSYSILKENQMLSPQEKKWLNPRLYYLQSFIKPLPRICPECEHELTHDEEEIFCNHCGLVVMSPIEYVGLEKIDYPFRQ